MLVAGTLGGALVLGIAVRRLERREGAAGSGLGVLNAFVKIGPGKRVTLVMPRSRWARAPIPRARCSSP